MSPARGRFRAMYLLVSGSSPGQEFCSCLTLGFGRRRSTRGWILGIDPAEDLQSPLIAPGSRRKRMTKLKLKTGSIRRIQEIG